MRVRWRRVVPLLTVGSLLLAVPGAPSALASPPPPTAAVLSPTSGAQVAGFVTVTATGEVDASVNDTVASLQLYVDGTYAAQKACPGSSASCTQSFTWDTTSLYGTHSLTVKVKTAASAWGTSPAVVAQVGAPPAASVDGPPTGSNVSGQVTVAISGTVDQLQPDTVNSVALLVDGAVVGTLSCTNDESDDESCVGAVTWDSTGLTGQHSLQARLMTTKGQTALSLPVDVWVTSPLPSAAVTSPGAVVNGTVRVTVSGAVDASQSDTAEQLALLVDGSSVGAVSCSGGRSCSGTVSWNPMGATGPHQLSAQLTTAAGRTGTSAATSVWVFGGTTVSLARIAPSVVGHRVTVTGRVLTDRGAAVAGARVRVVPVNGAGRSSGVSTVTADANGWFITTYVAQSRTTVTATVQPSVHWSTSSATAHGSVAPAPTCTVGASVRHGVAARVSCRLGDLPKGTPLALQVLHGRTWKSVVSAKSAGGRWQTSWVFAAKGITWVRVRVAASHDLTAATTKPAKVAVS